MRQEWVLPAPATGQSFESSGKYIALMDSDDYCAPDRFEKQLGFLEDNPDVSVVGSNMYLIDGSDNITGERKYPEMHEKIERSFLLTMAVANPSVIFRKKILIKLASLMTGSTSRKILSCGSGFWLITKNA